MAPKKLKTVGNDQAEERVYGPSWYDVYITLKELQNKWPEDGIHITLRANTGIRGAAGLRYDVTNRVGTILGAGAFLGENPSGHKTAAAAAYSALNRAYHNREALDEAREQRELDL